MKFNIKTLVAVITGLGAIASSVMPASAIPYNGSTVYRVGTGSTAVVYISGTAGSTIPVDVGFVSRISSRLAGACGEVVLSGSSIGTTSTIKVGNSTINLSSLPTQLLPTCNNGTFTESRSSNFKTPDGKVVIVGNGAGTSLTVDIPRATVRNVKINECGFGSFKGSDSTPLPSSFKISSTDYTISNLPNAMNAPRCSSGVGYVPATWLSLSGSGN